MSRVRTELIFSRDQSLIRSLDLHNHVAAINPSQQEIRLGRPMEVRFAPFSRAFSPEYTCTIPARRLSNCSGPVSSDEKRAAWLSFRTTQPTRTSIVTIWRTSTLSLTAMAIEDTGLSSWSPRYSLVDCIWQRTRLACARLAPPRWTTKWSSSFRPALLAPATCS